MEEPVGGGVEDEKKEEEDAWALTLWVVIRVLRDSEGEGIVWPTLSTGSPRMIMQVRKYKEENACQHRRRKSYCLMKSPAIVDIMPKDFQEANAKLQDEVASCWVTNVSLQMFSSMIQVVAIISFPCTKQVLMLLLLPLLFQLSLPVMPLLQLLLLCYLQYCLQCN